jgi:hypothetical protein
VFPEYQPQDYPPVKSVLLDDPFELPPGASVAVDLQTPESGDLVATIDWTHSSNNVVAVFASPRCASVNLALAGGCAEYVHGGRPSLCPAKPRVVTASVVGSTPVRLYVANTGATAESGRVSITLCRDARGCGAGMACGQCAFGRVAPASCP